jgi:hypothetical protein
MEQNHISKKKIHYTISNDLFSYLQKYDRVNPIPLRYPDLLRFSGSMPVLDKNGKDTLWESVVYPPSEHREVVQHLTEIYALLKTSGDTHAIDHLTVERIDYCSFGNSKPFRIKIINKFNDNHDYFYFKIPDASRVYGLEIEHILSPNRINYFVDKFSLIEEHIVGIPGDVFLNRMTMNKFNEIRIAKEFVKFNERCLVRLLGDMRAYNFVIDKTEDFDDTQYRIRAIDFDQQCYEGRKSIYLPQYFKENNPYVEFAMKYFNTEVVNQYQQEERSLIARRVKTSRYRLTDLINVMQHDEISPFSKVKSLRDDLAKHYGDEGFKNCETMGSLLKQSLLQTLDKSDRNILG